MRPFWLKAEFSCTHTHSIKITTRQSKRKIFQIHYCVLKVVTSITVKYFFNVTDREIVLAIKTKITVQKIMDSWVRFPPSMHETAGTFKVSKRLRQLGNWDPRNLLIAFLFLLKIFPFLSPSFAVATASSRTPKYNKNNSVTSQWSPMGHVGLCKCSTLRRVGKSIRMQRKYTVQCVAYLLLRSTTGRIEMSTCKGKSH